MISQISKKFGTLLLNLSCLILLVFLDFTTILFVDGWMNIFMLVLPLVYNMAYSDFLSHCRNWLKLWNRHHSQLCIRCCGGAVEWRPDPKLYLPLMCSRLYFIFGVLFDNRRSTSALYFRLFGWEIVNTTMEVLILSNHHWFCFAEALVYLLSVVVAL